ncbi:MAG: CRTAC1 family protein, partial [Planctomycetota bacterium]
DNDGDADVFITNFGADVFYTNDGAGRFTNATARAGFQDEWWGTSAAFGDVDGDGFLDLYVANYVRYDAGKRCTDPSDRTEYCGPRSFNGAPDQLWRNDGDGTFSDVTRRAGVVLPQEDARGHGLGVVITDLTRDGRADIFVANDAQANQLWVNQGDGRFVDEGVARGVGLNRHGQTEANMGIALGDVDGDLVLDLFVTHLWEEHNRLFLGTKGPVFRDFTVESKLARHDLERTGFGCGFLDFDHDADQDIAVANGAVRRRPPVPGAPDNFWKEYVEPNQLFENVGAGHFELADVKAGAFASDLAASRGLALGDVDGDGDLDLAVANLDNSLQLYENRAPAAGTHWLLVRVLTHGRDALGAHVLVTAGGKQQLAAALAGYSYCSSNDPRAHFGLGASAQYDALEVLWPDGQRERFPGGAADREVRLVQGEGEHP